MTIFVVIVTLFLIITPQDGFAGQSTHRSVSAYPPIFVKS